MIDANALKQVIQPLLLEASNLILDLTDGISMKRPINVKKTLAEAERVRTQLLTMWAQLNAGPSPSTPAGAPTAEAGPSNDPPQLRRLELLAWLVSLNALRPMGKARVDPETGKLELVFHWGDLIYHVTPDVVTINADEEIDPPPWMNSILEKLRETYGHPTWSFVSGSHFMSLAGPILRGST